MTIEVFCDPFWDVQSQTGLSTTFALVLVRTVTAKAAVR
jgi:hypothetical protein